MKWFGIAIVALFVFSLASTAAYAEGWRVADFTDTYSLQEINEDMQKIGAEVLEAEPTVLREAPAIEEKEAPEMHKFFDDKYLPFESQRWDG